MQPPTTYIGGYERAREADPDLADAYIEHTRIGDPLADAAMESIGDVDQATRHRLLNAGMDGNEEAMREAPAALRDFFNAMDGPPPFGFDPEKARIGARAFHRHSDLFFVGLVLASLITGLSEGLAKGFYLTGRTAGNLRRVKQNTRHLVDITLPGGLDRLGDGWKLTVRIRLIHAQVRRLLLNSREWDVAAEGLPLHMAHMALASTGFSAINLQAVRKLGLHLTEEERDGFMHIWRYVTWLLGVPDGLLFRNEDDALRLRRIAHLCELPPGPMAVEVAHGYINTVPELIGVTDPAKRKKLLGVLLKTSRALIGNDLADAFGYPKGSTFGVLKLVRVQRRLQIIRSKVVPGADPHSVANFAGMLQRSVYDDIGISYRMPDAVKDTESSRW